MNIRSLALASIPLLWLAFVANSAGQSQPVPAHPIVLHAARLLDVKAGRILKPGEILVQGERIVEVGTLVKHPAGKILILYMEYCRFILDCFISIYDDPH